MKILAREIWNEIIHVKYIQMKKCVLSLCWDNLGGGDFNLIIRFTLVVIMILTLILVAKSSYAACYHRAMLWAWNFMTVPSHLWGSFLLIIYTSLIGALYGTLSLWFCLPLHLCHLHHLLCTLSLFLLPGCLSHLWSWQDHFRCQLFFFAFLLNIFSHELTWRVFLGWHHTGVMLLFVCGISK